MHPVNNILKVLPVSIISIWRNWDSYTLVLEMKDRINSLGNYFTVPKMKLKTHLSKDPVLGIFTKETEIHLPKDSIRNLKWNTM